MALDAGWELVDQRGPGMRCATCEQRVAERALRGLIVGRKLSFGSFSEQGARLRSCLWSVLATLYRWRWMHVHLHHCAELGGATAAMRWMLWGLDPPRRHALAVPGHPSGAVP